jgi:hypothetical protein
MTVVDDEFAFIWEIAERSAAGPLFCQAPRCDRLLTRSVGTRPRLYYSHACNQSAHRQRHGLPTRQGTGARRAEPRPFDFASLEAAMALEPRNDTAGRVTDEDRAAALGVGRHSVLRLRQRGLTERQADELAIRLGTHPGLVWPELWWQLADVDDGWPAAG